MRGRRIQSLPPPHPALRATFSPLGRRGDRRWAFGRERAKLSEPWEGFRMKQYLLGLDAGNTVIKAVIFDRAGNEIAYACEEGHSRMPSPGHVERGLDELWTNARQVIRACIEKAKIQPEEIA